LLKLRDESTNIPAIGSEVNQKNQSKPAPQQVFQPAAVSAVVHQANPKEEDLEEGDKSFKDEEDEGERKNESQEAPAEEPQSRNQDVHEDELENNEPAVIFSNFLP
jgi:hypothetical protein